MCVFCVFGTNGHHGKMASNRNPVSDFPLATICTPQPTWIINESSERAERIVNEYSERVDLSDPRFNDIPEFTTFLVAVDVDPPTLCFPFCEGAWVPCEECLKHFPPGYFVDCMCEFLSQKCACVEYRCQHCLLMNKCWDSDKKMCDVCLRSLTWEMAALEDEGVWGV